MNSPMPLALFFTLGSVWATVVCGLEPKPESTCKCARCVCNEEVYLGALTIGDKTFAVTSRTEALLNGKPVRWLEIPDETTEPVEISVNLKRRVVTRVVYQTIKDF